jgi:FkbM family methyltransferase
MATERMVAGGLRVRIDDPDEFIQRALVEDGDYEPDVAHLVRGLLRDGDLFLDVGANLGYHSLLAAAQGARVYAFEPVPRLLDKLAANVALNGFQERVRIAPRALSDQEGTSTLYVASRLDDGSHSLLPGVEAESVQPIDVRTVTLDGYLAAACESVPTLIKIDVEGCEALVLDGAARTLAALPPPVWIFETGDRLANQLGESAASVIRRFVDRGYRVFRISGDDAPAEVDVERVHCELADYVAVHPRSTRREAVLALLKQQEARREEDWQRQVRLASAELEAAGVGGQTFVLADDDQLRAFLTVGGHALAFREHEGQYWGPPTDDADAIGEIERLRTAGARYLVFAWPAFWWLEHYREFAGYLRSRSSCRWESERLIVFDFCPS